ncbi:MAG: TPM domain-containing protein [Pseudomonadota bacterium]
MCNTFLTKKLVGLLLAITLALLGSRPAEALEVPALQGRVNDYAGILAPATARQLEDVLKNVENEESTQIVLLTVPSLEGASLEDFSLRVVEAWKLGQKKLDNGALLLISKNDRKLRIEVGYGLEGKLTDLVSGRIIRDFITPRFKEGNFDQGVIDGISAMIAAVKGEFTATTKKQEQNRGVDPGTVVILLLILFSVLGRILARVPWVAAGIGAVLAPVFGVTLGFGGLTLLALALLGFIIGLIAARMASAAGGSSSGVPWGGSSGFSSGSSGGFSGFSGGGGSFGGGGASGSW